MCNPSSIDSQPLLGIIQNSRPDRIKGAATLLFNTSMDSSMTSWNLSGLGEGGEWRGREHHIIYMVIPDMFVRVRVRDLIMHITWKGYKSRWMYTWSCASMTYMQYTRSYQTGMSCVYARMCDVIMYITIMGYKIKKNPHSPNAGNAGM